MIVVIAYILLGVLSGVIWTAYCVVSKRDCWLYAAEIFAMLTLWPIAWLLVLISTTGRWLKLN